MAEKGNLNKKSMELGGLKKRKTESKIQGVRAGHRTVRLR
jgi:hypothetical protein